MIPKIEWPISNSDSNPFGGIKGGRPLSITFHSKVREGITGNEKRALEILEELVMPHNINTMSFDGTHYPQILFEPSKLVDDCKVKIVDNHGKPLSFPTLIPAGYILKKMVINLMGGYSADREQEFNLNREDLLEAEAHYALNQDIFVTTSKFLIENRGFLSELNIRTPSETLKILGLYIRVRNEYEWVLEVRDVAHFIITNQKFYWCLARTKLSNYWRFATNFSKSSSRKNLSLLGLSMHMRCERALWARDEIAKLFYMPETSSLDSRQAYHFDYVTLLLAGALDALAEAINLWFDLKVNGSACSLNPNRDKGKGAFMKALQKKTEALPLFAYLTSPRIDIFLRMLYKLRNKIHSVSLESNFLVPESDVDEVIEIMYNFNVENHLGISKEKVQASTNGGPFVPSYDIKIDRYTHSYQLVEDCLKVINKVLELIIPAVDLREISAEELNQLERCNFLG